MQLSVIDVATTAKLQPKVILEAMEYAGIAEQHITWSSD